MSDQDKKDRCLADELKKLRISKHFNMFIFLVSFVFNVVIMKFHSFMGDLLSATHYVSNTVLGTDN